MKAVVWNGPHDLKIKDIPVPAPGRGEVLIKTRAVGICGSDMEIYHGRFKQCKPPMILGHEGGGVVEAVGEDVSSIKPGDRVAVECIIYCGRCEFCKQGLFGLCDSEKVIGMIDAQGEYAEYFVAPERNCHLLPEEISWIVQVLFTLWERLMFPLMVRLLYLVQVLQVCFSVPWSG